MNRRISNQELNDYDSSSGSDLLVEAGREARDLICTLYNPFPGAVMNQADLTPGFVRGFFDRFCDNIVPPPPPPPPAALPGGQCDGVEYIIRYAQGNFAAGDFVDWQPEFDDRSNRFTAPFGSVFLATEGGLYLPGSEHWSILSNSSGVLLPSALRRYYVVVGGVFHQLNKGYGCQITRIERADGNPDTCGDAEPLYPPSPLPTSVDLSREYNITLSNGSVVTVNSTVTSVNNDNSVRFPVTVNVGGVNVDIDLGGVVVRNVQNNNYLGGGGTVIVGDDGGGGNSLPNSEDVDIDDTETFDQEELPESPVEEVEGIERLGFVRLALTSIPSNAKTTGDGVSPTVYIGGWLEFKSGSSYYPRQFINFANNVFVAPPGADGFAYYLPSGYNAIATTITVKE